MRRRFLLALLDATVPIIVGAVIVVAGVLHGGANARLLPLAVGVAAAASLLARRRAPGWTLVVSGALVQVLFQIESEAAPVAVLAPAVALFSLALTRGRIEQLLAAAAAVSAVLAADALHGSRVNIVQTIGHVTLVAIPLLAAETLRTRRSYVSLLLEQLELAERTREHDAQRRVEQERMRIARDLHDVVAHTLTTINVQAATAAELFEHRPEYARAALETIEDASREAIGELRAVLGVLRDVDHPDAPRVPAPGVENLTDLVQRARASGLDVHLAVAGIRPGRLSDAVSLAAYRIVQESLTNAHRHAFGSRVSVDLAFESGGLSVTVESGASRSAGDHGESAGVGIIGMTERAIAVGGTLSARALRRGFRVEAKLPYALSAV